MDTTGTFWLPEGASTLSGNVDSLFYFIFWASVFFFILIVGLSLYFIIRYRRRAGREEATSHRGYNVKLEVIWTLVPIILVFIVFVWGFKTYMKMQVVPRDAVEIKVTGRQWMWVFDYPNGRNSLNELTVPVGQPIKLLLSSDDVIHSFYAPQFRVKQDVLPDRYTIAWFQAKRTGTFDLYCAEYCGNGHSQMRGTIKVVSEDDYASFLEGGGAEEGGGGMSLVALGKQTFTSRACHTCHTVDGSASVGPTLQNLYDHQVTLSNGQTITADENYIRQSILDPGSQVVQGFQPVMPTFQGLLSDRQIDGLIAYIKSLSNAQEAQ